MSDIDIESLKQRVLYLKNHPKERRRFLMDVQLCDKDGNLLPPYDEILEKKEAIK